MGPTVVTMKVGHKSRRTNKNERKLESKMSKKSKFSPLHNGNHGCWICRKNGHFKDECPYLRCRFFKMLGHVIADCPTLPEKLRVNMNETRRSMVRKSQVSVGTSRTSWHNLVRN